LAADPPIIQQRADHEEEKEPELHDDIQRNRGLAGFEVGRLPDANQLQGELER